MKIGCFFLFIVAGFAESLERNESYYLIRNVFVNGEGPFRFLLDTGAQSSAVSQRIADLAKVRPKHRVEQVTAAGSRLTQAGYASLRVANSEVCDAEVLIGSFSADADGVLGQSFLRHFDYLITRKALELDAAPIRGARTPIGEEDGRPVIRVRIDGQEHDVVLDSGAPAVVLFGPSRAAVGWTVVTTNTGSAPAQLESVRLSAGTITRTVPAVRVAGSGAGLLPLAAFRAVYVSNRDQYVVLEP